MKFKLRTQSERDFGSQSDRQKLHSIRKRQAGVDLLVDRAVQSQGARGVDRNALRLRGQAAMRRGVACTSRASWEFQPGRGLNFDLRILPVGWLLSSG